MTLNNIWKMKIDNYLNEKNLSFSITKYCTKKNLIGFCTIEYVQFKS